MADKKINKQQLNTAKQLGIAAAVCLFSVYGLFLLTDNAAKAGEKRYLVKSLKKVLPQNSFDNDLLATKSETTSNVGKITVYQACQGTTPRYQIYEIHTDKGYSGLIKLLVSVDLAQQRIEQIRPLFHQETPGLGDQIDVDKSSWLKQLALPLSTSAERIAVKQDKGQIDAITGATITSRAVSNAVRHTFFDQSLNELPNHCEAL